MAMPKCSRIGLLLLLAGASMLAPAKDFRIIVSADGFGRQETIVSFDVPSAGTKLERYELRDGSGAMLVVQVDEDGHACFIEKNLSKGASKIYHLIPSPKAASATPAVQTVQEGSRLKLSMRERVVLQYQAEKGEVPRPEIAPIFRRGGYIHSVYSLSGKLLTDDYPPNHLHHHGIWFAWTKTEFEGRYPNFWEMGEGKGTVEFVRLERTWSGAVHGGFRALHRFIDLSPSGPKEALDEAWEVKVYGVGENPKPFWIFDLVSTQSCSSSSSLNLPKYHYGGMGFRGNRAWDGTEHTSFLTSTGETNRLKGNETRGRWCYVGGKVDDSMTGVAILCHPDNFRAPQPMRLHPSEPFFCFAPAQLGDWQINPGKPYIARYRYVVLDGPPDSDELERMWNDYAHPPTVKVEEQ
jgi:hypothetical protein